MRDFENTWLGFASFAEQNDYTALLIFLLIGLLISLVFLALSLLRGGMKPDDEKNSAYECGFSPLSPLKNPFSIRFALVAILFIIFDIEIALLFPWALTLYRQGWAGFYAVSFFLGVLTIGFVYEWRSGALEWE